MKKIRLFVCTTLLYTLILQNSIVFANPTENADVVERKTVEAYINEEGDVVPPELLAEGAVLIDAYTGEVLFGKNENERLYPASITKVMTAILAIERGNFDDVVYFSDYAVRSIEPGSSSIGMKPEEILTLDEALNGLMIHSANEVSNAIAEYIAGSIDEFALIMTERARELGAYNTNFTNPHGLHNDEHYTTPYDIALIFRQGLDYPYFRDVIKRMYFQIPPTNITEEPRQIYGKNRILMDSSPYYYEFAAGGKTGFTDQAMHTLVTYAEKDGMRLIAAVMKTPANGTYTDTRALYEYGFNFFRQERIFDRYSFSREIPVMQATERETIERGAVVAQADRGVTRTLRNDIMDAGFEQRIDLPSQLNAPVEKGDEIGTLTLLSGGEVIDTVPLVALNTVAELSETEIKVIKKEEFIADTKSKLPIYLAFIPIVLLTISLVISIIIKMRKNKKGRARFGNSSKYRKYKFKKSGRID